MNHRQRAAPNRRIVSVVGIVIALMVSGCSVVETVAPPSCSAGGSVFIIAQSVPTASQVPCLDFLPEGWTVATVDVNQDRSILTLDSDRAGSEAAVLRLDSSCDPSGAIPAPSEFPTVERFDHVKRLAPGFRAERFYVFDGGCVSWNFDFSTDASATEAVAVGDALRLVSREELDDQLRATFVEEEL